MSSLSREKSLERVGCSLSESQWGDNARRLMNLQQTVCSQRQTLSVQNRCHGTTTCTRHTTMILHLKYLRAGHTGTKHGPSAPKDKHFPFKIVHDIVHNMIMTMILHLKHLRHMPTGTGSNRGAHPPNRNITMYTTPKGYRLVVFLRVP